MEYEYTDESILKSAEKLLRERGNITGEWSVRINPNLGNEEYSVARENQRLVISGGTASAVVYGVGRLIREPEFRGHSAPDKSFRAIYFATHFGNWYDNAPEDEIDRYIEDLAIWGCNVIRAWFDRHHFRNIMDPVAQKKLKNLKHIFRKSASLGMKNFLTNLANEAYAGSPEALRADWIGLKNGYKTPIIGGHYHVELCPSKPGALDLLLHWHEELLDALADVPIHYIGMSCYDQGGCTCEKCAPYGANGYWKIIPRFSELCKKKFPGCKVVLNTWRFDVFTDGEFDDLKARKDLRKYVDLLSVDNGHAGKLKDLSVPINKVGFSDISMGGNLPWGGYGVNPCPSFLETIRQEKSLAGNIAYSEGIYEDINKIMLLGGEWDGSCSAWDMIRKYAAFYFGKGTEDRIVEAARLMEENMEHSADVSQDGRTYSAYSTQNVDPEKPWTMDYAVPKLDKERAKRCLELVQEVEKTMAVERKNTWRWRIFHLRAEIDLMLAEGKDPENAMQELTRIYDCRSNTRPCLLPPAHTTWNKIISERRAGEVGM